MAVPWRRRERIERRFCTIWKWCILMCIIELAHGVENNPGISLLKPEKVLARQTERVTRDGGSVTHADEDKPLDINPMTYLYALKGFSKNAKLNSDSKPAKLYEIIRLKRDLSIIHQKNQNVKGIHRHMFDKFNSDSSTISNTGVIRSIPSVIGQGIQRSPSLRLQEAVGTDYDKGVYETSLEDAHIMEYYGQTGNYPDHVHGSFLPACNDQNYPDKFLCSSCTCVNETINGETKTYADCSRTRISDIPRDLPKAISLIKLSLNHMKTFSNCNVTIYPNLLKIDMSVNKLTEIIVKSCAPVGASSISWLSFHKNSIDNLENVNFMHIPYLRTLILSRNKLRRIPSNAFEGCTRLMHLDLSYNWIARIDNTSFDSLINLHEFILSNNKFWRESQSPFNPRVFKALQRLQRFDISVASRDSYEVYPNKILGNMVSLEELTVEGLADNKTFGIELTNLTKLVNVTFVCSKSKSMKILSPLFFKNVQHIKRLNFHNCPISHISVTTFTPLPNLESFTMIKPATNLTELFQNLVGLKSTSVKKLALNHAFCQDPCCRLSERDAKYITKLPLVELDLSDNNIAVIDRQFIEALPRTLQRLVLHNNRIDFTYKQWSYLHNMASLKEINLNNQNLRIQSEAKERLKYNKTRLILPHNLTIIRISQFTHSRMGRNLLKSDTVAKSLSYVYASGSSQTSWGEGWLPSTVQYADFSDNDGGILSSHFLHANNSLKYLLIQKNNLGNNFSEDMKGDIFANARHLIYLDMDMNFIFELPTNFLRGLRRLRILSLNRNRLRVVKTDFSLTPELCMLDLSKSYITWIRRVTRDSLDDIASKHELKLDITDNPLPCTCDGLELLQWMLSTKVKLVNRYRLTCSANSGTLNPIGNIQERLDQLQRKCASNNVIIASSVCALVVIGGVILLYGCRWKLKYARNVCLVKLYGFRPKETVALGYKYDAYVVYSQEDRNFALYTLLEELETKRGHKLCVEDRDFIPGTINFNNISCAIQNSNVTIFVTTPDLFSDTDLKYAFRMALMEEYSRNDQDAILLLNYWRPRGKLSNDFLAIMKKGRFLDYPRQRTEEEDELEEDAAEEHTVPDSTFKAFWDRLSLEIGHTSSNEPQGIDQDGQNNSHPQEG